MFNSLYKLATFLLLTKVATASPPAEKSPALSSPQGSINGSPPDDQTHKLLHYGDAMGPIAAKAPSRYVIAGPLATSKQYLIRLIAYPRNQAWFRVCHDNEFCEEHFNARNVYTNADGNFAYHVPGSRTVIVYFQTGDGQRQHDARVLALLRRNIPTARPSDIAYRDHLPEDVTHRVLWYGTGQTQ